LLLILQYYIIQYVFASKTYACPLPLEIFLPCHSMFSSCGAEADTYRKSTRASFIDRLIFIFLTKINDRAAVSNSTSMQIFIILA